MNKHIQSFNSGINQDISNNKYPSTNIYWAQNFRLISKDGLATGALTNVNGNSKVLSLGNEEERIVVMCTIRDTLIVLVNSSEGGKIYKWEHNSSDYETSSPTLIYTDPNLDFTSYPDDIIIVGRYETPSVQKIYFSDGHTFFKYLNIIPQEGEAYPLNNYRSIEELDLVPDVSFSNIDLTLQAGGNLKAGRISYAYQLYSVRGSESVISPESDLISITNSSDTSSSTLDYKGTEVGVTVNKSVEVSIENIDLIYERIRLYALEYTVFNQVPSIRIVGEYDINLNSIDVLDSGQSIGDVTLEELRFLQKDFYPKTMDIKNNILFAANLKENYFHITDEQFDARAFRFNLTMNEAEIYDGYNRTVITYNDGNLGSIPSFRHDAVNRFNSVHASYNFNSTLQTSVLLETEESLTKYNPMTQTLGGYGSNVSYTFTTNTVLLDEGQYSLNGYLKKYPLITCDVTTRENYSNPSLQAGYQRDEVYRFGIVFFDKKGRPSFTKWIGDIKFPSNVEMPYITFSDNKTYANILGINFKVNIPSEIEDLISGYKIVRVDRTTSDKTVLATGLVGYLANGGPGNSNNANEDWNQMMSQSTVTFITDMYNESPSYERKTPELFYDGTQISGAQYFTRSPSNPLPIERELGLPGFNPKYIEFTSPEVTFNKRPFTETNAFIEAFGKLNRHQSVSMTGPESTRYTYEQNQIVTDKFRDFSTGNNNKKTRAFLNTNKVFQPKEPGAGNRWEGSTITTLPDGRIFNNITCNLVNNPGPEYYKRYGLRGTFNLCTVDATDLTINSKKLPVDEFYSGSLPEVLIGSYKVDKGISQYGGTTYEARTYNTYHSVSRFVSSDEDLSLTGLDVYNGDTFINYFTYARSLFGIAPPINGDTIDTYLFFPVESSINLDLRLDLIQKYNNWTFIDIDDSPKYKISETLQQGVLNYGTVYPQELGDLYRYNSAYSCSNKGKEYYSEPFDFTNEDYFDARIVASETKINGEYIDSWTKFKFNNYIDVDSKHYGITKILTFKNSLYYFQPTAVGIASVNERSLLQDNQAKQLTLGTGGILTRFDYITDKSGSEFREGIIASDNFIYYVDAKRKRVNKIVIGKEEAVSLIKGIDSTLNKLAFENVRLGFDKGYNEVIVAIDNTTLAFNETSDSFTSTYSFNPSKMISINGDFYSTYPFSDESPWLYADLDTETVGYSGNTDVDPDWDYIIIGPGGQGEGLWKHNVGDPGSFYGGDGGAADSYVTLIINPNQNMVCYFDNLDIRTESKDINNDDVPDDIFYRLETSNSYQDITKELNFTLNQNQHTGTIKRIGRIWRTTILPAVSSGTSASRMIDTYLKVTLRYDNSSGNKFKVHDITTYYRPAKH